MNIYLFLVIFAEFILTQPHKTYKEIELEDYVSLILNAYYYYFTKLAS